MCGKFWVPSWLLLAAASLAACGTAWKFAYEFPDRVTVEVKAATSLSSNSPSAWALTPPNSPTTTPATIPPSTAKGANNAP